MSTPDSSYAAPCPCLPELSPDRRASLIAALRDCVGASHVLARGEAPDADLAGYERDWRKRW